jgi:hypothetical protein
MITKLQLQSIINKYYLSGAIESVKWEIKDDKLKIRFMTPSKDTLGELIYNDFKMVDGEIAIFDTSQLNKLVSITSGTLLLDVNRQGNVATRLNIQDSQFNLTYALADTMLIGKVATVSEPEFYAVKVELNSEAIAALIKAKSALPDSDHIILNTSTTLDGDPTLEFIIGEDSNYSNKITYSVAAYIDKEISIPFNANIFKEILSANKDIEKGTLSITFDGLMKLTFENEAKTLITNYFMVRKAEQ